MALTASSYVVLSNGSKLPLLGFGTYLCSNEEAAESCLIALRVGYRHIDTAEFYNNHEGVAAAMKKSGLSREEIFITDKVAPGGNFGMPAKTYDETIALVRRHLARLETTYIDLFLLHHAFAREQRINQWRALVDLQKEGVVREIGVSNWDIRHIEEIRAANLPLPAANQIEIHPLCTQSNLVRYLRENHIVPIAYSSLAPLSTWRSDPTHRSAKTAENSVPSILQNLSEKYQCSEAQLLLRWALQHGYPILPKSIKEDRVRMNGDLYYFDISAQDMESLDGLNCDTPFAWPTGNPLNCD